MLVTGRRFLGLMILCGIVFSLAAAAARAQKAPPNPELKQRQVAKPDTKVAPVEGRLRLDVVITDGSGNPVAGLDAKDFALKDNDQPQTIVTFHASDGTPAKPDSRVSLFLMMDTVNSGLVDISFMRDEVEKFLRQNGGHLAQPTTVVLFTDAGFEVVGKTSLDGNTLADGVHVIKPVVHTIHAAAGGEALLERFQLSGKALGAITAREMTVPGRKMMIWIGPGWPIIRTPDANYDKRSHELNFDAIASLTNQLRQARMVLCSAGGGTPFRVQDLMKPVKSPMDANSGNLALQVLALQSGGQTLDAGNRSHPAEQLNTCMQEIGASYTVTFNPPAGERAFTYHALKVTVAKPGLKVNTTAGYYAEP
jgi:VWFA-related protein